MQGRSQGVAYEASTTPPLPPPPAVSKKKNVAKNKEINAFSFTFRKLGYTRAWSTILQEENSVNELSVECHAPPPPAHTHTLSPTPNQAMELPAPHEKYSRVGNATG